MFDVAASLQPGFARADATLRSARSVLAASQAAGAVGERAMASLADSALFQEALLSAVHARLSEIAKAAQ
ncbi:MAG TPA: hypothetical protein VMV73_01980 [Candidatus Dormibacteraeota bacterium]|nr:hypothetical protein [Candidatus Dormibacteraeota bacterium]